MSKKAMGRYFSKETRRKLSNFNKGKQHSEKTKQILSENSFKNWENPLYIEKYRNGLNLKPNKPETFLLNLLNDLYPNEWKYTGDFSFTINGKCPDFTNVNGQKQLIELFGDYWHKDDNPQDRVGIFKEFGWNTLVIWEKELKDIGKVIERIRIYIESGIKFI